MPTFEATASITRRAALGLLGAAGIGALAWPSARPRVPAGRTEITYWEKWSGREAEAMQRVVDRFNASQDRVWVTMVPIGEIASKAMVAIGGGDPPDVCGLYSYSIPAYAAARAAIPLNELAGYERLEADRYLPGIRRLLSPGGRQWAGVNTCYTLALYCNHAMLRDAGAEELPRTIGELDALAERLTVRAPGGRLERVGFLQNLPLWWPYVWPLAFGGRLYDEVTNCATCAAPECVAAFEWIRACAQRYGVAETRRFAAALERSTHTVQDAFISGRAAMILQGPWLANFIRAYNPNLDYAAAPMPTAKGVYDARRPIGLLEADVLIIPRGCPHPEEAFEFLCFTQRRDVQEELASAHCKPSPFAEVSRGFFESHPNRSVRVFDAIARSPAVQILPQTRVWKQYSDLLTGAFESVWSGADPARELGAVQARAQDLIDRAARLGKQRGEAAA